MTVRPHAPKRLVQRAGSGATRPGTPRRGHARPTPPRPPTKIPAGRRPCARGATCSPPT